MKLSPLTITHLYRQTIFLLPGNQHRLSMSPSSDLLLVVHDPSLPQQQATLSPIQQNMLEGLLSQLPLEKGTFVVYTTPFAELKSEDLEHIHKGFMLLSNTSKWCIMGKEIQFLPNTVDIKKGKKLFSIKVPALEHIPPIMDNIKQQLNTLL